MGKLSRRDALTRLALGGAGAALYASAGRGLTSAAASLPASRAAGPPGVGDLTDLATRIRTASAAEIFDVGAGAIKRGADIRDLLGAAFVAGVQDIRPHGVGGKFHAVLMVESAFQLAAVSSDRDAHAAALWTLWDFKRCQARDVSEEGDWVLPPRPDVTFSTEAAARTEFVAAMEGWDVERADRAIVGLLPFHDRASLFEILWPFGMRCFADLGHKVIFCAHAERTLARLGTQHAEPALRSLVQGLLYTTDRGPETAAYAAGLKLLSAIPDGWRSGTDDPDRSLALLTRLRESSPAASQQVIVDAIRDGLGPATVWDGLRLHAAEIFHRRPPAAARRHAPVHPVTELNAMFHIWRTTRDDRTRKLAVLQTAGWLALLRDELVRFLGPATKRRVDTLGLEQDGKAPAMRALFEAPSPEASRVRMDLDADGTAAYLAQLRRFLYERAFQDHQYKFVAVLHEEAGRIHPRWASRFLAPAISYVPTAVDPLTEMRERSLKALSKAGV